MSDALVRDLQQEVAKLRTEVVAIRALLVEVADKVDAMQPTPTSSGQTSLPGM